MQTNLDPMRLPRLLGIVILTGILLVGIEKMPPAQALVALLGAAGAIGTAMIWTHAQNRKDGADE